MKLTDPQENLATASAALTVAIAGPGSGKTGVLIERYGHFREISDTVILTFTVAAAAEIRRRITARGWALPAFIGTLHAWCARLLLHDRPAMRILDEEQARTLREEAAREMRMEPGDLRMALASEHPSRKGQQLVNWYRRKLAEIDSEDFDTLLLSAYQRLQATPVRVRHLMVDEYQDSTLMDHAIYSAIHTQMRFVVGDPDQAIYCFRGASSLYLRNMAESPGAFTQFLEANFRCCQSVCALANHIIARGRPRDRFTVSATGLPGTTHVFTPFPTDFQERAAIIDWANSTTGKRAILCRYNHQVSAIQQALIVDGAVTPAVVEPEKLRVSYKEVRDTVAALSRCRGGLKMQAMRRFWQDNRLSMAMRDLIEEAACESPEELALWLTTWEREQRDSTKAGDITVCTVHAAKGLEWDHVWLAGVDASAYTMEAAELLFVAATRARLSLLVSYATSRPAFTGASTMIITGKSPLLP